MSTWPRTCIPPPNPTVSPVTREQERQTSGNENRGANQQSPHEFVSTHAKEILARWLDAVEETVPDASNHDRAELADHFQAQLDVIAKHLADNDPDVSSETSFSKTANLHGRVRASFADWSGGQVVQEFIVLRHVIIDMLSENGSLTTSATDIVTGAIETAIVNAVTEYSRAAQEVRQKLIGSLVHDVRTPLNVVHNYLELINSGNSSETRMRELNEKAKRSIGRCLTMLEEMLDTVKSEAGHGLLMRFEEIDLNHTLQVVCEEAKLIFASEVVAKLEDHATLGIFDDAMIARTVENLISNAVKFSSQASPIIVSLDDRGSDLVVKVKNAGTPIPPEDRKRIFGFFYGPGAEPAKKKKGWGLGLALIKTVARNHGGEVIFESSENDGTTFGMTLPKNYRQEGDEVSILL